MIKYYFSVLANFSFKGRARRAEYWWFAVFNAMAVFALNMVGKYFGLTFDAPADQYGPAASESILTLVYELLTFIQLLALTVRRFHDRSLSGWWLLLFIASALAVLILTPLVPALSAAGILPVLGVAIFFFVITVLPGTAGPNKYGEDPKAESTT
jgi:uncharacterized membrane protein YhaH (DUF805 family)